MILNCLIEDAGTRNRGFSSSGFGYDAQRPQRDEFGTESAFRQRGSFGEMSDVSFGTNYGMYRRKYIIIIALRNAHHLNFD